MRARFLPTRLIHRSTDAETGYGIKLLVSEPEQSSELREMSLEINVPEGGNIKALVACIEGIYPQLLDGKTLTRDLSGLKEDLEASRSRNKTSITVPFWSTAINSGRLRDWNSVVVPLSDTEHSGNRIEEALAKYDPILGAEAKNRIREEVASAKRYMDTSISLAG
jgi:hypothetical protein